MERLNHCSATYDSNTLISYSTLIYKRTEHYTFVYRYHSPTTTQHFYKFCDKLGIDRHTARYMWNYLANKHSVIVIPHTPNDLQKFYYTGDDLWNDRARFVYPEEVPHMGYNVIDLY